MRNKSIKLSKKVAAIILCASMTCGLLSGCGTSPDKPAKAESTTVTVTSDEHSVGSGTGVVEKSETVYVIADANGNVQEITVSDWLKNPEKYQNITDASSLENIIAIKGSETFSQNGSNLDFTANGNDVYYRGSLPATTELPVSLDISYKLDGNEITKEELKGASGHLEIHIQYKNHTSYTAKIDGQDKEISVPFLSATMLMLPSNKTSNMKIENGKIIEQGDNNIIVGYGFPGVNESFGIEDGGVFTDTVDFSADVTDYSPDMMMTFVTSEVFASSNLDEAVDVETVSESLQEVTNTSFSEFDKLESFDDLDKMVKKLKSDGKRLDDGANQLKDGASDLADGTEQLVTGAKALRDGTSDLSKGTKALKDGTVTLKKGALDLKNGIGSLQTGVKKLDEGSTQLNAGIVEFRKNLAIVASNLTTASAGSSAISEGMKTASESAGKLAAGANQVAAGVNQAVAAIGGTASAMNGALATLDEKIATCEQQMQALIAAHGASAQSLPAFNQLAGAKSALTEVRTMLATQMGGSDTSSLAALQQGAAQVAEGASQLNTGLATLNEKNAELAAALSQLATGCTTLNEKSEGLETGSKQVAEGLSTLNEKSAAFTPGIKKFITGTNALVQGAIELNEGSLALYKGTRDLYDGVTKLNTGAHQLYDGTIQLTDGTAKLSKAFSGNLAPLLDTAKALKKAAQSYNTFTALPEDGKGSVSFVIKTE